MTNCIEYYKSVNNWDDLIQSNLLFMNGFTELMDETFYFGSKLHDETIDNDGFFDELINLNKNSLLTVNSQPFVDDVRIDIDYHLYQHSYVEFYVELSYNSDKLYNELIKDNRIYVGYINYDKGKLRDNLPTDSFNLTKQKASLEMKNFYDKYGVENGFVIKPRTDGYYHHTNWIRKYQTLDCVFNNSSKLSSAPMVKNILNKSCKFFVVCAGNDSAPNIVLEIIKNNDF
jgi:hypothetical protein